MIKRIDTAVIMAGGMGTRVAELTRNIIPKCMLILAGKTILEHQIIGFREQGVKKFIIVCSSQNGNVIRDYYKDGESLGVNIRYFFEEKPLGSAGSLKMLKNELPSSFFVSFSDTFFCLSLDRIEDFFFKKNADIVLLVHPNSHPFDSDVVVCDEDEKFKYFLSKNDKRDFYYNNLVNGSFFLFSKNAIDKIDKNFPFIDMESDVVANSKNAYCYKTSEYIKDTGTPTRFREVENDIMASVPFKRRLNQKQRAIFLDRDGTINKEKGFINNPDDFELEEHSAEAVKKINKSPYLAIVITNQPVIARGECSEETLLTIHQKMECLLARDGAYLNAIYYCPHHPDSGFEGEVKSLKINCDCRKPGTALLKRAEADFNIDLSSSWFVGDGWRDIQCGKNASLKTVFIKGNDDSLEKRGIRADFEAKDCLDAVDYILSRGDEM